jgi:predicted Zn-dependent protease
MKQKLVTEFFAIAASFFAIWFLLSQINFVTDNDIEKITRSGERKLSELVLKTFSRHDDDFDTQKIRPYIDSIGIRLCEANHISYDSIKIHIINNSEVNAFALPDHNLVIYTGLLEDAKSAEEVAGVMAHEIGHMEKQHVMKKLAKEIGISMLFLLAGGNENFEVIKETSRVLSSTAFDRSQEREADDFAVEAMAKAEIDVEPFGSFLFRLSTKQEIPDELVWISTHPDSKARAANIFTSKKDLAYTPKSILATPWQNIVGIISATR